MKSKQAKIWDIFAYAALAVLTAFVFSSSNFTYPQFGTIDFIEYWTAFNLAIDGSDPYNYENMLAAQQRIFPTATIPTMMWNPPYLLALLSPAILSDFSTSARMFFLLSLSSATLSLWLVCKMLGAKAGQRGRIWLLGITFPAALTCLNMGQIGNFLGLCLLGGIILYFRDRRFLAGCLFALCSVKPHLFLLVIFLFLLNDLMQKKWGTICGGGLTLMSLVVLTHFMFPGIFEQWFHAIRNPEKFRAYSLLNWRPATLVGLFRVIYSRLTDLPMPLTPMWLFPLLNLIVWGVISLRIGTERVIKRYLPEVLLYSVLLSPYGWIFDQSFLLLPWGWAYLRFEERMGEKILLAFLLATAAMSLTLLMIMALGLVSESFVGLTLLISISVLWARWQQGEKQRESPVSGALSP